MKYKMFIIMFIFMIFNIKAYALIDDNDLIEINPEWIKYKKLPEEDKKLYEAIPEQFIYKYIPKENNVLKTYNKNYFSLDKEDELPTYFNLANIENKRYVNSSNKNQRSLGLCWAFGAIGSLESNILYNGVVGLDEAIAKCDENEPESNYCRLKEDKDINDYYVSNSIKCENEGCANATGTVSKQTIDNANFSERSIDYIRSKPTNSLAYNVSGEYTLIKEGINPYSLNYSIGSGGSFSNVSEYYRYGIVPIRTLEGSLWENYSMVHEAISLYDLYDSVEPVYQVTNYYDYPSVGSNVSSEIKDAWIIELKKNIKQYGSVYVTTVAPQNSSAGLCYYNDSKNNISLINNTGNCGSYGYHAMQIVGWDDDYEFEYCRVTQTTTYNDGSGRTSKSYYGSNSESSQTHNKTACETEKIKEYTTYTVKTTGEWTSGKGAWILKNSWGSSKTYPYLSYQSIYSDIHGVREVSVANFDNSYNQKNSNINKTNITETVDGNSVSSTIFEFEKTKNKEYLTRLNFTASSYPKDYKVYVSNNGIDYNYVSSGHIDYPGMYSVDVDNYDVSGNRIFIKITGISATYSTAFTKNYVCNESQNPGCSETKELYSETSSEVYNNINTEIGIITRGVNIVSGTRIVYKIYNENNEEVTNLFNIGDNYLINNTNKLNITATDLLNPGKYYLHTISDSVTNILEFTVVENVEIELIIPDPIFVSDTVKIKANLSSIEGVSNYTWKSSNNNIASIDQDGNLNIIKSGKIRVTFTADALYGTIKKVQEIVIYEPIHTVDDFMTMLSVDGRNGAYYLMNDLDFSEINFDEYNLASSFTSKIFDGGNHTVKNIKKTGDSVGIFNELYYSTVKNLRIENSTFKGDSFAGSVAGYSHNSTVSNIYTNSNNIADYAAGGIIGYSEFTEISNCYNAGKITSTSMYSEIYSGGIIGASDSDYIENCYNEGEVYSEISVKSSTPYYSRAGGIFGISWWSELYNSYNTGKVVAISTVESNISNSNGIGDFYDYDDVETLVYNSYYLEDSLYTLDYPEFKRTLTDLKQQSNYIEWDFNDIWHINEDKTTPSLKTIPVIVEDLEVKYKEKMNTNGVYDFNFLVKPYSTTDDIIITSEDENLFTVQGNEIITKDKIGSSEILFKIGEKEYKYPITVNELLSYSYDDNLTKNDINVKIQSNYFKGELDVNTYLKLKYKIGEEEYEKKFDKNTAINEYTFIVKSNNSISLDLYLCNNTCNLIETKKFNITNIDKEKPLINYVVDNLNDTLQINIKDLGVSGLEDNIYEYAISNNDKIVPTKFNAFLPNTLIKDVRIDRENKYLWIKNISDKVGNKVTEKDYIIYPIDLDTIYYTISYYDENNVLKKVEKIKENDNIIINYKLDNYEDDNYYYIFDNWSGFKEGMIAEENIKFYAVYKKEVKKLKSNLYKISDEYIYNIKLSNINNTYSQNLFISNLEKHNNYNFYDNNNKIINDIDYIKTGMRYKNEINKYILILSGDVTGDGRIKMNDIMKIANHLIKKNVLSNEYLIAGDVTGDSDVKMNDVMKIASTLVKGGSL